MLRVRSPILQSATISGMNKISRSTLVKSGIILLLAIPHIFMVLRLKEGYQGAISILPVAATRWFFIFRSLGLILIGGISGWSKNIYEKESVQDVELTGRQYEANTLLKITIFVNCVRV